MNFSEKILYLRKQRGLSRKELAKLLGLAYSTIAKYETNPGLPEMKILQNMSDFFNVPIYYLTDNFIPEISTETTSNGLDDSKTPNYDNHILWKNIYALCLVNKITIAELSILSSIDASTVYNFYNGLVQPDYNSMKALFNTLYENNLTTISDTVINLENLYDIEFIFSNKYITIIFKDKSGQEEFCKQIDWSSIEYAIYKAKAFLPQTEKDKVNEIVTTFCARYKGYKLSENQFKHTNITDIKLETSELNCQLYSINYYINALEINIKSLDDFFQVCVKRYVNVHFEELEQINTFLSILDLYIEKYKNAFSAISVLSSEDSKFYTHIKTIATKHVQIQTIVIKLYNIYEACVHKHLGSSLSECEEKLFSQIFGAFSIYI